MAHTRINLYCVWKNIFIAARVNVKVMSPHLSPTNCLDIHNEYKAVKFNIFCMQDLFLTLALACSVNNDLPHASHPPSLQFWKTTSSPTQPV